VTGRIGWCFLEMDCTISLLGLPFTGTRRKLGICSSLAKQQQTWSSTSKRVSPLADLVIRYSLCIPWWYLGSTA